MMDEVYLQLIKSGRVGARTREVLLDRLRPDMEAEPPAAISSRINLAVLQAVVDRLIPQIADQHRIGIAGVLVLRTHRSIGDGWRFAKMPPDKIAFESGLKLIQQTAERLHGAPFTSLNPTQQDAMLRQIQHGEIIWPELNGQLWFEELLAGAVEVYASHPATLAQMGFGGIAFLPGWPEPGLQTTQAWEPVSR